MTLLEHDLPIGTINDGLITYLTCLSTEHLMAMAMGDAKVVVRDGIIYLTESDPNESTE